MAASSEDFQCTICYNIADDAIESQCCHKLFCKRCLIEMLANFSAPRPSCPYCRVSPLKTLRNVLVARIISNMPATCRRKSCLAKNLTRGMLKDHEAIAHNVWRCPAAKPPNRCFETEDKLAFARHLAENHTDQLCQQAAKLFEAPTKSKEKPLDPIKPAINGAGEMARLGGTGKFYCGEKCLRCDCCDGYCGPENGCNCSDCMQLDVKRRNLPKGYLVNKDGAPSTKKQGNSFFCGRLMSSTMRPNRVLKRSDMESGFQCNACLKLSEQIAEGNYNCLVSSVSNNQTQVQCRQS